MTEETKRVWVLQCKNCGTDYEKPEERAMCGGCPKCREFEAHIKEIKEVKEKKE